MSAFLFCIGTEVSGQCVISNGTSLMIPDGTNNVTIWCTCGLGTRWFFPDRSQVRTAANRFYVAGDPYYINNMNPNPLTFPTFTNSHAGTYTCSHNSLFPMVPPGDNIILQIAIGTYLFTYIFIYLYWF